MTALICAKCGREILPGTAVEFVGDIDMEEQRIATTDEILIVHAVCPKEEQEQ